MIRAPSLPDVARYPRAFVDLEVSLLADDCSDDFLDVLRGFILRAAREHRV